MTASSQPAPGIYYWFNAHHLPLRRLWPLLCLLACWLCPTRAGAQGNAFYQAVTLQRLAEVVKDSLGADPLVMTPGNTLNTSALDAKVKPKIKNPADQSALYSALEFYAAMTDTSVSRITAQPLPAPVTASALLRLIKTIAPGTPGQAAAPLNTTAQTPATTVVNNMTLGSPASSFTTGAGGSSGGVSMPLESRLIYATADLIVDRFRSELSLTFFRNFRDDLESNAALKALLPNTTLFLANALKNPLLLPSLGSAWKGAFEQDMQTMPEHAAGFLQSRVTMDTSAFADCIRVLSQAFDLYNKIKNGAHPIDVIHDFRIDADAQRSAGKALSALQKVVRLLDLISQNLSDETGNGGWVSARELKALDNPVTMRTFVYLLFHNDSVTNSRVFADLPITLEKILNDLNKLTPMLSQFRALISAVDARIQSIQGKQSKGEKIQTSDYLGYVQTVFDIVQFGHKLRYLYSKTDHTNDYFTTYLIPVARGILHVIESASEKNYGAALSNVVGVLGVIESHPQAKSVFSSNTLLPQLIKYGSFMTDIINAQTVEDTRNALEAAALPAGSYSIKRTVCFSMTINAYGGLSGGYERVQDSNGTYGAAGNHFGVFAPVGIEFSAAMPWGSLGLFASILDLGAVVNYRLTADSAKAAPNVGLAQVFSPGAWLTFGLGKNIPLTIGFGYQFNPKLRQITAKDGVVTDDHNACKISAFVAVDIPLFQLYNTQN